MFTRYPHEKRPMDSFTNSPKRTLYSPAASAQGSWLEPSELMGIAQSRYPGKVYRPLKHWIIIDVVNATPEVANSQQRGFHSVIVYGQPADTDGSTNHAVVSDCPISFDSCFFETESIVYILMKDGFRQTLDSQLVDMLDTTI